MKKRLLITSIVMMLVVAVALSTATYAWFTSSASVTANTLTMYAAVNTDSALEISYTNTETFGNWKTSIEANSPSSATKFEPAAAIITASPAALVAHDSTHIGTYFAALDWKSDKIINGHFIGDLTGGNRYIWQDDAQTPHETIFLHNGSTANAISNINITAAITGAAQSFIRIAVFKNDGSGNFELYGILSNGQLFQKAVSYVANTDYYASTADDATPVTGIDSNGDETVNAEEWTAAVTAAGGMLYTKSATTGVAVATADFDDETAVGGIITDQTLCTVPTGHIALGGLGVNNETTGGSDEMELKIVVWMDGSALNDNTASTTNKTATINLTFTVGAAV